MIATATKTKITFDRIALANAFAMVSSIVNERSPNPILQSVHLSFDGDGAQLLASNIEQSIRYTVLGVMSGDNAGSVMLPTARVKQILQTSNDEQLNLETEENDLRIVGMHSKFEMPTEDPTLFPNVPEFEATDYHVVTARDLKRMIRQTIYATDVESTRYALGGVMVELHADGIRMVATDGRRLARSTASAELEGQGGAPSGHKPVVPIAALKLIERNISDDDPPVHIAFVVPPKSEKSDKIPDPIGILIRTDRAVIHSRLVEGRFPRYEDVLPKECSAQISMEVGALLSSVTQAAIIRSEESRSIDFTFANNLLKLDANAANVGKSKVEVAINYDEKAVEITFDPQYLIEALKVLPPSAMIMIELIDHKNAAVFRREDNFIYVVMPLSRDR